MPETLAPVPSVTIWLTDWLTSPDWVGQVGGVIAIVVFLGGVVVYLRGSRDKGTITTLEQNNKALDERVAILEASEKRLKEDAIATKKIHDAEVKALELRVAALETENERLQAQRPSAEVLVEVSGAINSLRTHMEQHDADIKALFENKPAPRKGTT